MTRALVLSIRFLGDRYHGLTDNGERPEWPPSPFRLFQAIVAGNARGDSLPEPIHRALRWLEQLPPPAVSAPVSHEGSPLLTYVLNNTSDTNPNSRTPKTIRPMLLNGDRLVQYSWLFDEGADGSDESARVMAAAVRHIRCLGWGIDLAVGRGEIRNAPLEELATRVQFTPVLSATGSGCELRVPRDGSILSLQRSHLNYLQRNATSGVTKMEPASAVYESHRYVVGASRPNIAFGLVDINGDTVAVRQQHIKQLVGMIRKLTSQPRVVASLGKETVDTVLLGHAAGDRNVDHMSILPLPTIRSGPTDGWIRRVMLVEPLGADGSLIRSVGQLLDGCELCPEQGEDRFPSIFLKKLDWSDRLASMYAGVSCEWASVTPVLLPGYDDRKAHRGDHQRRLARANQLVNRALVQSGIIASGQVELSRVPFWAGSLHVREYAPREKQSHYPRWHVKLLFDRPITGPFAIGAGRYCGFGLMAIAAPGAGGRAGG